MMDENDDKEIEPKIEIRACDTEDCVAALAGAVNARNLLLAKCGQVSDLLAKKQALGRVALKLAIFAMTTLLMGAILLGISQLPPPFTVFAGPAAAALALGLAVLVTAAALAAIILIMEARLNALRGEVNVLRTAFVTATNDVMASCPPQCWGIINLTVPC